MLLQYYNVISKLLIEQGLIFIFCIVMSIKSVKMLIKLKLYFSLFITAKKKGTVLLIFCLTHLLKI